MTARLPQGGTVDYNHVLRAIGFATPGRYGAGLIWEMA